MGITAIKATATTLNKSLTYGLFVCLFVCLFLENANAYITAPIIIPTNPTIKDEILVDLKFGGCHEVYNPKVQQENNIIKLTADIFENIFNACLFEPMELKIPLGQLSTGNYELEFYARTDTGDGYGDLELQAVIPFNVQNIVGVPVDNGFALFLMITGMVGMAMWYYRAN